MHGIWPMAIGRGQTAMGRRTWRNKMRGDRNKMETVEKRKWKWRGRNQKTTQTRSVSQLSMMFYLYLKKKNFASVVVAIFIFTTKGRNCAWDDSWTCTLKKFFSIAHVVRVAGGCAIRPGLWMADGGLSCWEEISHCCLQGRDKSDNYSHRDLAVKYSWNI